MNHNIYTKKFYCYNCENPFIAEFPKGKVAIQGKCPHCEVAPQELQHKTISGPYFDFLHGRNKKQVGNTCTNDTGHWDSAGTGYCYHCGQKI